MISKIIHQISFKNKKSIYVDINKIDQNINDKINMLEINNNLDKQLSWINKNKDWKYILWNENSIKLLILKNNSYYYNYYIKIKSDKIKKLFSKYIILYNYGGVYLDNDIECLKSLNELLELYPNRKLLLSTIPYINNFEKYHIYKKYNLKKNLILLSDSVLLSKKIIILLINK